MNMRQTILRTVLAVTASLLPAAHAADPFHFWFQRDGGCIACAKMPPPGDVGTFPQKAGIDVMFNGFNQSTGKHWQNQDVLSYAVTYTYTLAGATHSVKQTAAGSAASVVIKPYPAGDLNQAQIVGITVAATYSSGTVTKTVHSPAAFDLY